LAATLFLANLWAYDLWAPDEPYFAEGAREMLTDGEWLVPHVNGVVTTDKPPLFFWIIALISAPFGHVYSITARLPSVIAALATLALVMRLGRRFGPAGTGALAGTVLCTTFMFWEKARWTQIESTLCLLIWLALSAFEAFRSGEMSGRRAGLIFSAAAALAVLAKGPVGLLLPLGIVVTTLAADRNLGSVRRFAPVFGPLVFVTIVGGWAAAATFGSGGEYSAWGAFREHALERAVRGMHHAYPWYHYSIVMPPQLLPWTGLVPGAVWLALKRRDPTDRFLLAAAFFVVLFFSISTEKRELYVLPAFPAIALMIARFVVFALAPRGEQKGPVSGTRWIVVGQSIVGGLLAVAGLALLIAGHRIDDVPRWVPWIIGSTLLTTGVSTFVFVGLRRMRAVVATPAVGFCVAYLITAVAVYPAMEPRKSARPLARHLAALSAASRDAGNPVVAYRIGNLPEPIAFYGDGLYTIETGDPAVLERHLLHEAVVFAAVDDRALEDLSPRASERVRIIARYRLGQEVWLISNEGGPGTTNGP